ncbi:MAG: Ppx/GppA family phosphatase [Candidatus Scalindua sp.]|nr:Ppx/GppA family phosphatase [Candidatus Scalindua sp.]
MSFDNKLLKASIDLGTNTCLLLIAEVKAGQVTQVMRDYANVIRLGESVDQTGYLQSNAMKRALSCLSDYEVKLAEFGILPGEVVCVATSQARSARNSNEFFYQVMKEIGFRFKIISAADEAQFTFFGSLLPDMDSSRCAVVDLGGGSTEFAALAGGRSVDLGSVRFTERYLTSDPVTDEEFNSCLDKIDNELEGLKTWRNSLKDDIEMVAVAGTATTLASWHLAQKEFNADEIEKVQLSREDFLKMVNELKYRSVSERLELLKIEEGRADVILAGAMIYWRIMEKLDFPLCRISPRGLRYGVLMTI